MDEEARRRTRKLCWLAKDLASVRAELADRVAAEASARTEVAQMTKLLEAKETEWTKRLDAERESSAGSSQRFG